MPETGTSQVPTYGLIESNDTKAQTIHGRTTNTSMTIDETQCQPNAAEEADFQEAFSESVAHVVGEVDEVYRLRKNLKNKAARLEMRIEQIKEDFAGIDDLTTTLEGLYEEFDAVRDGLYEIISRALGSRYTTEEVQGWYERAEQLECSAPRIHNQLIEDLMYERKVPNAPFRDAHSHATSGKTRLAAEAVSDGDLTSLARMVGSQVRPSNKGSGKPSLAIYLSYENAEKLAKVFSMDPRLAGI